MENIDLNFVLEEGVSWEESCCQIEILAFDGEKRIGEIDSFVLGRLMLASVSALLDKLPKQHCLNATILKKINHLPGELILQKMYAAQWEGEPFLLGDYAITSDCASIFCAFPTVVESFDGEIAYLILNDGKQGKLIWRDYESKRFFECNIDFNTYIEKWKRIQEILLKKKEDEA
jgi:hypothetical protein